MLDKKLVFVYVILISTFIIAYPFLQSGASVLPIASNSKEIKATQCKPIKTKTITAQDRKEEQNKASFIFTMDDGWVTQYTEGYQILKDKGIRGSIAVIPTKIGTKGYMTLNQLHTLYSSGWDLMNHTNTHRHLAKLSKQEQKKELNEARTWLNNQCFTKASNIAIYPYGSFNQETINTLQEEHYRSARTIKDGVQSNDIKKYEIQTINLLPSSDLSFIKKQIDEAIKSKQTIIFTNHRFDKKADKAQMNFDPEKYKQIVNYVVSKKDAVNILTYSEWLDLKEIK